jgi:hypothetical protein
MEKNKLKTPHAIANWQPAISPSGLAFVAPDGLKKGEVLSIYKDIEDWLDETAAKWGSCLREVSNTPLKRLDLE